MDGCDRDPLSYKIEDDDCDALQSSLSSDFMFLMHLGDFLVVFFIYNEGKSVEKICIS